METYFALLLAFLGEAHLVKGGPVRGIGAAAPAVQRLQRRTPTRGPLRAHPLA